MIERRSEIFRPRVLLVSHHIERDSAVGRAGRTLVGELEANGVKVLLAPGPDDGYALFGSDAAVHAVLVDWLLGGSPEDPHAEAESFIEYVRQCNERVPLFLLTSRETTTILPEHLLRQVSELIWLMEDSAPFIGGRILAAVHKYSRNVLGPMAQALIDFDRVHEYSWHTPGHTGGVAFQKHPAGRIFYDYFGESVFRSDLSISVGELGSLLDHSGPIGEGEKFAARVFGADRSYTVTNGTSTSNRVIWTACVGRGQPVLVDRNCHKSNEQGLTMTGAVPTYLMPTRNRYGIIGPIPPEGLFPEGAEGAVHAVITNSTYDGLTYNVDRVLKVVGHKIDRIHFDEAWYGYARFHPLYAGRYAMRGEPTDQPEGGPTLFATHSTHKLLAAFSQASFIHMREGRRSISHARFNESFMMHASTSPFYPIIASNDVSASMMDGRGGTMLVDQSIREAIAFRQSVMGLWRTYSERSDWFFRTWNPETVNEGGDDVPFDEATPDHLATEPACWVLHPGDAWHGFDLEDDYCMLDPIKVSVLTPGLNDDGSLDPAGFPASLLTAYLDGRGIVVEKTTDFSVLFLFSLGITNAKWSTLVHAMIAFKDDFDANTLLSACIPQMAEYYPGLGLRDLAEKMMATLARTGQLAAQDEAFSRLPVMKMIPADAYQRLVAGEVERVPLEKAAGRVAATGIVPYPPGIPLVMPGEEMGTGDEPFMRYLLALQEWDRELPGFCHDTHGIEAEDGTYYLLVQK
ncbi:MAG: Orn/Lys/Arg decarboxylase N-terminal domain-containing protein [Verrucomicrobiota bacterium JB024]|nr:Orn/Lys/Arg decarboxylase N-terminal domain-containing protein [Verrucomicrobiota bacterium JB024]